MVREAPAMTVRQNLGELLNEIQYRGDSIVITKSGKRVAAIVDIALFQRLQTIDEDRALQLGNRAQTLPPAPPNEHLVSIDAAQADAEGFGRLAALLAQIDLIPEREDAYDPVAWDEHGLPQ
ncbi:type II toxin-antitoxin system prevent-host-death family antitoxin [Lamprocystis purpurea]|uniref:type II toxin-antitoxin system prevent-host-death family antitoxin n=1 Tax=Lamprocystis purpurea TaxID=61598 RepID=UPI0003A87C9E|nr:type II toxin-antitoxin system prevent-host-death family antitoxin [Lamprocystis purpurea]